MLSDSVEIKPAQCCIKLVFHLTYTMMHGSTKLKFSDAKQAREIYNYKKAVLALIRRCDDLPATITHVPVAAALVFK